MVQWSNAPLLVFHQCMDREWTSWGLDSARQFAKAGFAVIRVKSEGWRDLKEKQPNAFRTPYIKTQTEQQMICTIVMRDITCPLLLQVMTDMNDGTRSKDLRTWNRDGLQIELPPGDAPCVPRLDVVAVTEASAWLADDVTPAVFRALYNLYSERLVWAGFNGDVRSTGSKLVLGEPHDFSLLKEVFERLKVYHIDQQYKSFQNKFFSIVWSKTEIVVGSREHVSGCCDRNANADKMQAGYKPKPRVYDILKGKTKKKVKLQGDKIEHPTFMREHNLIPDYPFYITNQIMKPLMQIFALVLEQIPQFKPSLSRFKRQLNSLKRKYAKDLTKMEREENKLRNAEVKKLIFDEALRQANNSKQGQKSIESFFG